MCRASKFRKSSSLWQIAVLLLVISVPMHAGTISAIAMEDANDFLTCQNSSTGGAITGASASCTQSQAVVFGFVTASDSSSGDQYGLHAYSVATLSYTGPLGSDTEVGGFAIVSYENPTITTTSPLVRYVTATFTAHGSASANGVPFDTFAVWAATLNTPGGSCTIEEDLFSGITTADVCSVNDIPFSNTSPFNISDSLETHGVVTVSSQYSLGEYQVDVSHTANLYLTPLDANFQVVPGAALVGSDGEIFSSPPASATPEPSTYAFFFWH